MKKPTIYHMKTVNLSQPSQLLALYTVKQLIINKLNRWDIYNFGWENIVYGWDNLRFGWETPQKLGRLGRWERFSRPLNPFFH